MITLEVLQSGPHALVEDLGRPGLAHLGVTRSGAADRRSHRLANRLLANPDDRATIEATLGGFSARVCGGGLDIAVTGADANPTVDGIPFGTNSIAHINDGQVIALSTPRAGLRSYLGVRGGIAVPETLGSRSYDTLSGIGPAPLRAGDVLPVGQPVGVCPEVDQAPVAALTEGPAELRMIPGPRYDWFIDPDAVVRARWVASDRSDRVGVRLVGPALQSRWPGRQLPSEGAVRGAVQVPPNGQAHQVGSTVCVGVVLDSDTDVLAQLRPGQPVRLRWSRPGWYS